MLLEQVEPAKTHQEAGAKGGRGKKATDNNKSFNGDSQQYLIARLKRDNPQLAESVIRGELTAHAAALAAGFRKPTKSIPVDSPESAVRALLRVFNSPGVGDLVDFGKLAKSNQIDADHATDFDPPIYSVHLLLGQAGRIQARAISRCGELLKQIEPKPGARTDLGRAHTRGSVATQAGLSERQRKTALRVAISSASRR
jgi:hypothetical protein